MAQKQKIPYENWLSSAQKWAEIVKRIEEGEEFSSPSGFYDLEVVESCGYCQWARGHGGCWQCSLARLAGALPVCGYSLRIKSHFSLMVSFMGNDLLLRALPHARIVKKAILDDCPDKDKAIKDGIVF